MPEPVRVLLAKIGLDSHDRGIKVIASALKASGMEVIYTGLWQSAEQIVATAIQEDVDVIGISSLAYDHLLIPQLLETLKRKGRGDIPVTVGGIIPDGDIAMLEEAGVKGIFRPGTSLDSITAFIRGLAEERRAKEAL